MYLRVATILTVLGLHCNVNVTASGILTQDNKHTSTFLLGKAHTIHACIFPGIYVQCKEGLKADEHFSLLQLVKQVQYHAWPLYTVFKCSHIYVRK